MLPSHVEWTITRRLSLPGVLLAIIPLTDPWGEYALLVGTRSVETLNAASRLLFQSMARSNVPPRV